MHGLKRRVDANSLSLFSQPPFAKPGIVFSTFGKLISEGACGLLTEKTGLKKAIQKKRQEKKKQKKKSACH